jgi:hypothetical protein
MSVIIDTCGWIEWLTDGVLADNFAPYLSDLDESAHGTTIFSTSFLILKWN